MAVDLNDAVTVSPVFNPSRSDDAAVISARQRPDADPDAVSQVENVADRGGEVVLGGRVGRAWPPQRDLPRRNQHRDPAGAGLGQADVVAGVEHHVQTGGDALEVVEPGELSDERGLGGVQQLGREPGLGDVPVLQHDHAIGERDGLVVGMGDDQRGHARPRRSWPRAHPRSFRGCRDRAPTAARRAAAAWDPAPAPGPARPAGAHRPRAPRLGFGEMVDADPLEQRVHRHPGAVGDVRAHAHVREQRVVLEHEPDPAAVGGRAAMPVVPHLAVALDPARRPA